MHSFFSLYNFKKFTSLLAIFVILITYTVIKLPYFNHNFTGEHPMKYSAYVEPALHMSESNNFFENKKQYYADPLDKTAQESPPFPILEWKLATMYKIFPNFSIEMNTRLVMYMFGILTLIFSFLFLKEFTNKKIAFFSSMFLATNPIFGLATFVTVYDSVILMYLFSSLYFLTLFLKNRKPLYLIAIAGVLAGFGIVAKITLLVWLLPIVLIIIFFKSPNFYTRLFDTTTYLLFLLLPYIATKPEEKILSLAVGILLAVLLTKLLENQKEKILFYIESLHKKKFLLPIIILTMVPILLITMQILQNSGIREEFVTDSRLLFNFDMYFDMTRQFVRHLGIPLALLGILGIFSLFFIKEKDIKVVGFSFLISGFLFLITSAKSIFFHDYYTIFLMTVILLQGAIAIYFITEKVKNFAINTLIFFLIFLFILIPRISHTQERFEPQQEDFDKALEYFIENTLEDDFYIDEVQATYFSTYSKRKRVGDLVMLEDENFKSEIREFGFKETMEKYSIKYLITFNEEPEYEKYVNIFSKDELQRPSYRRTDLILSIVNPEKYEYFDDLEQRERIVQEYKLKEKFVLEKEIGDFKFFRFEN